MEQSNDSIGAGEMQSSLVLREQAAIPASNLTFAVDKGGIWGNGAKGEGEEYLCCSWVLIDVVPSNFQTDITV